MSAAFAKNLTCSVVKTDELGVVFGWGLVCTEKGVPYYDTQGDHIPEDAMLKAVTEFMLGDRLAKVMHRGPGVGKVVQSFALTTELAGLYGLPAEKTGWMVGVKFDDPEIVDAFRSGKLTGFSLGGHYETNEVSQ